MPSITFVQENSNKIYRYLFSESKVRQFIKILAAQATILEIK